MYTFVLFFIHFVLSIISAQHNHSPLVSISNGKIQGTIRTTVNGKQYHAFEGIPYATPPIGDKRFAVPEEPESWDGILEATNNGHFCPQILGILVDPISNFLTDLRNESNIIVGGTEDCLYLNVFTTADLSNKQNESLLPILVWIHGGAYQFGSKEHMRPQYFLDQDIIVVTINYRVGLLGFLSTEDGVLPSNIALKDQHFALKWISRNIEKFGGDPNKVTLGGLSPGSASTNYHLLSPSNKGLFRAVIMESGSALCPQNFNPNPRPLALKLGQLVDPKFSGNSTDLLTLLRKLSVEELLQYGNSESLRAEFAPLDSSVRLKMIDSVWVPTVEDVNDPERLITRPMHQDLMDGRFIKVPMLLGYSIEECLALPSYPECLKNADRIDKHSELLINSKLNIQNNVEAGRKLKEVYTSSFAENPGALMRFLSDNYYITPIVRVADLVRKHTSVYLYQFAYEGHAFQREHLPGAEHIGHLGHVPYTWSDKRFPDKEDQLTLERMSTFWSNFIKFLNPTPEENPLYINWPKTTSNLEYMNINKTLSILTHPRKYKEWKQILDEYMSPPFYVY